MNFTINAIANKCYNLFIYQMNNLPTNQKIEKLSTGISFKIEVADSYVYGCTYTILPCQETFTRALTSIEYSDLHNKQETTNHNS